MDTVSRFNFVQEFQKLLLASPRYNLKHVMAENCDYADTAVKSKNCYYSFGVFYCEDVYYSRYSRKCTDCNGVTFCVGCQLCTECMACLNCYQCAYCQNCQGCTDCKFSIDCFGCSDCFGCVGLYQKKYCIFNEQLIKEVYLKRLAQINLVNPSHLKFIEQEVENLRKTEPELSLHQLLTEDCIGENITESKNCYQCYDTFASEDCFYTIEANANKDCCDLTVCFETELSYSCVQSPLCYNCNFLYQVDNSSNSEFCAYSRRLKNCFGCVYLEDKEYYILNKQYSPEDYATEVDRIKKKLVAAGEYNMKIFLVSDYEKRRMETETDPVIKI